MVFLLNIGEIVWNFQTLYQFTYDIFWFRWIITNCGAITLILQFGRFFLR